MTPLDRMLAFIRKTETGTDGPRSYITLYGHHKLDPPLTEWTLDQAIAAGPEWTRKHGSSAAGAYQFMRATLMDLKRSYGLMGFMPLNPEAQDKLATYLLRRRGWDAFLTGEMRVVDFAKRLAMEWASFPVLEPCQGGSRWVTRGQSYYAGDGLNKALVSAAELEAFLHSLRHREPEPVPAPEPPLTFWQRIAAFVRGIFA